MKKSASYRLIITGALFGAAAVVIGAFGAHGLKPHLSAYQTGIFEKGVQYHFYHTLALLMIGALQRNMEENKYLRVAGRLFATGIVLFSGSLYLLACRDLIPLPLSWVGPVTPIGGLCFIAGWSLLAWGIARNNSEDKQ